MKRWFSWCALLLLACGPHTTLRATSAGGVTPATSGATASAPDAGTPDAELPQAWLWRVSGGDAAAPSYVLGTMHVGVRMSDALPHPYDGYLHDARALVMEVDAREVERFMAESARTHHGTRGGRTLDRALGRETWQRLVDEMAQRIPGEILRRVPPGTMTLYLQQVRMAEVEAVAEGREPIPGAPSSARLDATIFDWAIREACPVVALETPEQALAVLESVADTDVLASLHEVLDRPDEVRARLASLRSAYLAFDEDAVLALIAEGMSPAEREAILIQRNRAWEPALFPQIQQGNAFVAVGVGHLLGEGSVLEALTRQGYTVERLGAPSSP